MEWMILPFKRYFEFSGRSQRKEYWMFALFCLIARAILIFLDNALGLGGHSTSYSLHQPGTIATGASASGGILSNIFSVIVLIPTISVGVRRLHDINRTGWWLLALVLIFIVGGVAMFSAMAVGHPIGAVIGSLIFFAGGILAIVLLVWACTDGTRGANRFGADPKGYSADLRETFR